MGADGRGLGEQYDPFGAAHTADPHAFYDRARAAEPVFFSPALEAWVVTRHEDVLAVLKDHRRFGSAVYRARAAQHTPEARAVLATGPIAAPSLVDVDPPEHTRLRAAVTRALPAQRIAALEPRLRRLTGRLIDGFELRGRADFMDRFARRLPTMVIGSLLDVPEADFASLQAWSDDRTALMFGNVAPDAQPALARSAVEIQRYILDLAERRRASPGDDLASELIRAGDAGDAPLSTVEVAALLRLLFTAGFETTIKLLGSAILCLLSERERWCAIVEDADRIPAVVEEMLRLDGPVVSTMRTTREAVEMGGVAIPEGALVQVLLASGNHDAETFAEPGRYDSERERAGAHLGFGFGVHFCVGAPLARLEMRVALEELGRRLPSLRLVPGQRVGYQPSLVLRGPDRLLVEWDPPGGPLSART